jgi:putative ABC transport system permease protein
MWTFIQLEDLWRDGRHAARVLSRAPGHTAAIVLLLALAIGPNAAIFTLINAIFIRELPVDHPEQLVVLKRMSRGASQGMSIPLFEAFRQRLTSVSGLIGISDIVNPPLILDPAGGEEVSGVTGAMVSGNYFRILGVKAAIGRVFSEDDDRLESPDPVLVLSHAFWQRQFGGDRGVIGRSVLLSGSPFTVVGVAAQEFRAVGGDRGLGGDFWVPLNVEPLVQPGGDRRRSPDALMLRVRERLQPEVSIQQVQAQAQVVHRQLPEEIARPHSSMQADRGSRGFGDSLERQYRTPLRLLTGAVGMLLLVACANVASLLLARGGLDNARWRCGRRWAAGGRAWCGSVWWRVCCWPDWGVCSGWC